jgi:hypothetical protein
MFIYKPTRKDIFEHVNLKIIMSTVVPTISGGLDATVTLTSSNWTNIFELPRGDHTLMLLHSSGLKCRISLSDNEPYVGQLETFIVDSIGFQETPLECLPGVFQFRESSLPSQFELRRFGVNKLQLDGRIVSGSDMTLRFVCTTISADTTAALQFTQSTLQNIKTPSLTYHSENGVAVSSNWKTIFRMIYPGTQDITIKKCYVIVDTMGTINVRVFDVTNAIVIAEETVGPVEESLFDLGTISNLPTTPSHFELQARQNTAPGKIYSFHAW